MQLVSSRKLGKASDLSDSLLLYCIARLFHDVAFHRGKVSLRDCDKERTLAHELDRLRSGLDLNSSIAATNLEGHAGSQPSLDSDLFRHD